MDDWRTIEIWKIQVLLVLTFLLNVIINYYSGFKEVPDWRGAFEQALEVMAVGIVAPPSSCWCSTAFRLAIRPRACSVIVIPPFP